MDLKQMLIETRDFKWRWPQPAEPIDENMVSPASDGAVFITQGGRRCILTANRERWGSFVVSQKRDGNAWRAFLKADHTPNAMLDFVKHYGPLWDSDLVPVELMLEAHARIQATASEYRQMLRGWDELTHDGRRARYKALRARELPDIDERGLFERAYPTLTRRFNERCPELSVDVKFEGGRMVVRPVDMFSWMWLRLAETIFRREDARCRNKLCTADKPMRGDKHVPCSESCRKHVQKHPEDDRNDRLDMSAAPSEALMPATADEFEVFEKENKR